MKEDTDKKLALQLKKRWARQPANIIKGIDPVAVSLLKQMYAALKDRGDNLGLYERVWVKEIEKCYSDKETFDSYFINGLGMLLRQALTVIGDDPGQWDVKEEELYGVFHKLIFLKLREGDPIFKTFFDNVEATILAGLQGDFSRRVALTKIGNDQENIFTYAAVMVNTLMDSLQTSVVSVNSVNDMLDQVPGTIVIITDLKGKIKFINRLGSSLFQRKENIMGSPISSLINVGTIENKGTIQYTEIDLKIQKNAGKTKAFLYIIPNRPEAKIEEITYFIDISKSERLQAKINASSIVDHFFKKSVIPHSDDLKIVKEIYSYSYAGNKSIFISLLNTLLENAVNDTRKGKDNIINVHFSEVSPEKFILKVSSSGWGYKSNQLPKIFESELRVVKEYCDKLNARVEIDSRYLYDTVITVHLTSRN